MAAGGGQERGGARDRDRGGRARNARPRDELGRPLPYGAAGVEPVPDDLRVSPAEGLDEAQRLIDAGRPFQAHEVLEAVWKSAPLEQAQLWRGLAQLAVGLTHLRRGNRRGALALLRRGSNAVAPFAGRAPYGVDCEGLAAWAATVVAGVESRPYGAVTGADVAPLRLRGSGTVNSGSSQWTRGPIDSA